MNDLVEGCKITGDIRLDGEDIYGDMDVNLLRKRVGMVFQKANPFPMSIYDNIAYGPRTHGIRSKAKLDEIVERSLRDAAIWDEVKDRLNKSALGMSGGQQQRLCIARALAVQPEVLLMDEPTSALDPISTSKVEDLVMSLKNDYTIIIVTHNMQQATRVSDRTAFFLLGEVVEYAETEKLFSNPQDKRTEDYISGGSDNERVLRIAAGKAEYRDDPDGRTVRGRHLRCDPGAFGEQSGARRKGGRFRAEIDQYERDIERLCMRLLLLQQPVATDLRVVSSALKMISDLERIGDQAADIADITKHVSFREYAGKVHIKEMAKAAIGMVTDSVDSYVKMDAELAKKVAQADDQVDDLFVKVRQELVELVRTNQDMAENALDLMMIAKYLERIGDHAVNVAEWVMYAITGKHEKLA